MKMLFGEVGQIFVDMEKKQIFRRHKIFGRGELSL
jgi:hypothetical protein